MNALSALLAAEFTSRPVDLTNGQWHHGIPNKPGWYFIETDAPLSVLRGLPSPPSEYKNNDGEIKKCKNYNIPARASALASALGAESIVISTPELRPVYSGMAKSIFNRAREHTFAHQGTAGLALANYQALFAFRWNFHYIENNLQSASPSHSDIMLKLGEQVWRATHGWPLLCSG